MFKVGDRVEWCWGGQFDSYGELSDTDVHDFGTIESIGNGYVDVLWESGESSSPNVECLRKVPIYTKTRKNLKLELRVKGLELTVKVLEQDEADTFKHENQMEFEASNGFTIRSLECVGFYNGNNLFIKGSEVGDRYTNEFASETELKDFIGRLKQAVKEFNAAGGFAKTTEETVEIVE